MSQPDSDRAEALFKEYVQASALSDAIDVVKQGGTLDSKQKTQLESLGIDPNEIEEVFTNG